MNYIGFYKYLRKSWDDHRINTLQGVIMGEALYQFFKYIIQFNPQRHPRHEYASILNI